ncbi:MAG TPA: FAD-dependent monooxygenase [Polyangiaceae bacterium]
MNSSSRLVKPEVLVVGAGPVGLLSALLLHRRGITVHVVDEAWRATARSYAAALHQTTLDMFEELGIDISKVDSQHRLKRIGLYDRTGRRAEVETASAVTRAQELLIVPQNRLEALLEAELAKRGVNVNWNHRLARMTPDGAEVDVEVDILERTSSGYAYATTSVGVARSYAVRAKYVFGADGHASVVRRQLGAKYEAAGPASEFDVFEFQSNDAGADEMKILFAGDTTNVLWTLPGGRQRWSFQVDAPNSPQRDRVKSRLMMSVPGESSSHASAEQLSIYLKDRAPFYSAQLGDIVWAGDVRFEPHLVNTFGRGNMWLLGDAAHQTGPVGIQSMNVGLREARDLAAIVASVLRDDAPLSTFSEYETSRRSEWQRLLQQAPYLRPSAQCEPWLTEHLTKIIPCLPASGSSLESLASRLGFEVV